RRVPLRLVLDRRHRDLHPALELPLLGLRARPQALAEVRRLRRAGVRAPIVPRAASRGGGVRAGELGYEVDVVAAVLPEVGSVGARPSSGHYVTRKALKAWRLRHRWTSSASTTSISPSTISRARFPSTRRFSAPSASAACRTRHTSRGPTLTSPSDRKSTRLNSSHLVTSYAVFCLTKKPWYCRIHSAPLSSRPLSGRRTNSAAASRESCFAAPALLAIMSLMSYVPGLRPVAVSRSY